MPCEARPRKNARHEQRRLGVERAGHDLGDGRADEQAEHPGALGDPLGHDRREHGRRDEADPADQHRHRQPGERRVGLARAVEVVAVEQDQRDGRDAVEEPVHADRGQPVGRRPARPEVPEPVDEPPGDVPDRLAHRGARLVEVRPEQVARDAQRERPRHAVQHRGDRQHADVAVQRRARSSRSGRRCRRARPIRNASVPAVGVSALAVIRSSGSTTCGSEADKPGEQEAVDREAGQDQPEQHRPAEVGVHGEREHARPCATRDEVRPGQHLPARPPVQQHARRTARAR